MTAKTAETAAKTAKTKSMKTKTQKILTVIGGLLVAGVLLLGAGAYFYGPTLTAMTTGSARFLDTDSPKRYTSTVLSLAEQGIYADSKEFADAAEHARAAAKQADSLDDVRAPLNDAVRAAGGKHSRLIEPDEQSGGEDAADGASSPDPGVEQKDGLAWATVPGIDRNDDIQGYADTLSNGLAAARDNGACGAVVDLRGNGGGDMGPMLAGLSPLLPDGTALEFEFGARTNAVTVDGNSVKGGGTPLTTAGGKWDVPVAVLVDGGTASSGEATMLSFRGLDNSRSFGTPTAGFASANTVYDFPDGSELMLTIAKDRDRNGATYSEDPIDPDVKTDSGDVAVAEAERWLRDESGCS